MTQTRPAELGDETRLLIFGSARDRLDYLATRLPDRSVVVVDDPEVLARKRFRDVAGRFAVVDEVLDADIYGPDGWMTGLERRHATRPFTAVVPGLEYPSVAAARFADHIGLPGAGATAAHRMRNKDALMACARDAGIPCPSSTVAHCAAEVRVPADTGRWVLKPTDRQAGVGVQVLGPDADLEAAWAAATGAGEGSHPDRLFTGACLVQPYLDGPEYSVECLVVNGEIVFRNVTEQVYAPELHTVQIGHVVPARANEGTREALLAETARLIAATGFRTGVVHAEWIIQDGRPLVVDCAGRLPGDSLVELIELAYDVDLEGALLLALTGRPVRPSTQPVRASAIAFCCPPAGTIVDVRGVHQARASDGVIRLDLPETGTTVGDMVDGWSRCGEVVVQGADNHQVASRVVHVVDQIDIHIASSDQVTSHRMARGDAWLAPAGTRRMASAAPVRGC
jgi:biotin carboxylase